MEAAALDEADTDLVYKAYNDVVRCLDYASTAEKIIEAEALQEVLLAICAPALAKIRAGHKDINLNAVAKSITPELSGMFDLQAVDGKLQISLASRVLDVTGFPITVAGGDDVLTVVASALGLD